MTPEFKPIPNSPSASKSLDMIGTKNFIDIDTVTGFTIYGSPDDNVMAMAARSLVLLLTRINEQTTHSLSGSVQPLDNRYFLATLTKRP